MPNIGERVFCRPAPGEAVQRGEYLAGQFLPEAGAWVTWTTYHERLHGAGSILLSPDHYHRQRIKARLAELLGQEDKQPEIEALTAELKALKGPEPEGSKETP